MKTYNQIQPATSRTLPCGSRPSSQPPLHTVLQTYMDRSWDYVPMRSVPERSSDVTGVVQGFFIGLGGEGISMEEVFDLLKEDPSIIVALGELSEDKNQQLGYLTAALTKIEEGCNQLVNKKIKSQGYASLVKKVIYFLGLIKKGQPVRPQEAVLLKINRLAGSLQKRADVCRDLEQISSALAQFIETNDFSIIEPIFSGAIQLFIDFKGKIGGGRTQGQWHLFDSLSLFGPLSHALLILYPEMEGDARTIDLELREIRQLMETNQVGISVVAHRGMGPTNRSMGGLILEDDPRRINRPAENSPGAFGAAMGFAGSGGLDGVECDVFLSKDGIPMLSHEEKVREQLSKGTKAQFGTINDGDRIGDLDGQTLSGLLRTSAPESRFMTLEELLDRVAPVAAAHYDATRKAFRVEVEMKGTNIKGWSPDQVERNRQAMELNVTCVISRFKKRNPNIPIEILLFNGNIAEVRGYARKRREKTALGSIYTGFNIRTDSEEFSDLTKLGRDTDELRYMMRGDPGFRFTGDQQMNFITTLVYDVETAPGNRVEVSHQPTGIVNLSHGSMTYPNPLTDFLTLITLLQTGLTRHPNKIRLLTDYAGKASYLKGILSGQDPHLFKEEDIQGVFNVFFAVADNIQANLGGQSPIPIDREHRDQNPGKIVRMIQKYARDTTEVLDRIESFFGADFPMRGLVAEARARVAALEAAASPTVAFLPVEEGVTPDPPKKHGKSLFGPH